MKNLRDVMARLRRAKHASVARTESRIVRPGRDWFIGLCFFALIVVCGSAISGMLFLRYSTIDIRTDEANVTLPRYNENMVSQALDTYTARRTVYESILERRATSLPPTPSGPSATSTESVPAEVKPEPEQSPVLIDATPAVEEGTLNFE